MKFLIGLVLSLSLASCAMGPRTVFFQMNEAGKITQKSLDRLLWENVMGPESGVLSSLILKSDLASYHLIQIRGYSETVSHEFHDLAISVESGTGKIFLEKDSANLSPGAVVFIKHGTSYSIASAGESPLVIAAFFSPFFDEKDTVREKKMETNK